MAEISGWMIIEMDAGNAVNCKLQLNNEVVVFRDIERPSLDRIISVDVQQRLREWRSQRVASQWFGLRVCDELCDLPWASAVQDVLEDDPVVWTISGAPRRSMHPLSKEEARLLLAVWLDPGVPGLRRELDGLAAQVNVSKRVALNPTDNQLEARLSAWVPTMLHMALVTQGSANGLLYRDETSGDVKELQTEKLLNWLPVNLRLAVFNTCDALAMARGLTRTTGVMTIAWSRSVMDERARAFALFFYEQLARGTSLSDAILMFTAQSVAPQGEHRDLSKDALKSARRDRYGEHNPVVLVSDPHQLDLHITAAAERGQPAVALRGATARDHGLQDSQRTEVSPSALAASIQVEPRDAINPAMLINGDAPLKEIVIVSEQILSKAVVEVTCDTGIGISQVRRMVDLIAGVTTVNIRDFQFPVLYELLRHGVKRRPVNFRFRLLVRDSLLAEETTASRWMSQDEWIDSPDTYEYLPAFIDPEASVVKELWKAADPRIVRDYDGETASRGQNVSAYVMALYQAMRALRINYIQPPTSPVGPIGRRLSGQRVRSPAEVVKDQRGTCHDLALLFAACMEHIGLYPIVVLVRCHTFVGYWNRTSDRENYWKTERGWLIHRKQVLQKYVDTGAIVLIESTEVTGPRDVSFEQACVSGRERLDKEEQLDAAVDIRRSRGWIDPL